MSYRKAIYSAILILFCLSLIFLAIIFHSQSQKVTVNFLNVGQGDAILIEQGSKQILIDGGPSGSVLMSKLGKYIPFWDRDIELVIATHPDADHITGLVEVMKNYQVDQVIDNGENSDSSIYEAYKALITEKNISHEIGRSEMNVTINENSKLHFLNPTEESLATPEKDTNAKSLVAKMTVGSQSFLFTGDISYDQEKMLRDNNQDLRADYLKISHHGSKYATSQEFLDKVQPMAAIISVGKDNRYGHPSPDVIGRLEETRIEILRTDQFGDIIYECSNSDNLCSLAN